MLYQQTGAIWEILKKAQNILLIAHEKPDGDTLGASLAMSGFLSREQKNHDHFCLHKPASYFGYMPLIEKIITEPRQIDLNVYDVILTIDCGDIKRTGLADHLENFKTGYILINIDHHQSNNNFGHYNLVLPQASSTSEIMYNFFICNKIAIDSNMATNLLTGIITDTMTFSNAATTNGSLEIAGNLLQQGARISLITKSIKQNKDLEALKLWGQAFKRLDFDKERNFAYTVITQADKENPLFRSEALDGLANFLGTLQEVDFIMLLEEENDNIIGHLRTTKDNIDVAKLAGKLGGGGHQKASGFKISKQALSCNGQWKNDNINAIINQLYQ